MAFAYSDQPISYIGRTPVDPILYPVTITWGQRDANEIWHACSVVYDGPGKRDAYIDGQRVGDPDLAAYLYRNAAAIGNADAAAY